MSHAEFMPAANGPVALQKWYYLFPENWTQIAFDPLARIERLKHLLDSRQRVAIGFWGTLACVWIVVFVKIAEGYYSPANAQSMHTGTFVLMVIGILTVLFQAVQFLRSEVEILLLQMIERLSQHELNRTR